MEAKRERERERQLRRKGKRVDSGLAIGVSAEQAWINVGERERDKGCRNFNGGVGFRPLAGE